MIKKLNLIAAIIALAVIGNSALAQKADELEKEVESRMTIPDSQRTQAKGGLTVGEATLAAARKDLKCMLGMHSTIIAGINDNLAMPTELTFKNPQLAAIFPNTKDFDDPAVNRIFAHSFSLKSYRACESKLCAAQLLIRVCNNGADAWANDKLYVGFMERERFSPAIFYGNVWSENEAKKCKDVKIALNTATLANLTFLDVVMQDDSTIDYMQLDYDY